MTNCPYPAMLKSSRYHCRHDADLQAEYGPAMTCDAYWSAFYAQDGACGACGEMWLGTPGERTPGVWRLSVDHEHASTTDGVHGADGPFRGLLCQPCNRLLTEGVVRQILRRTDELEISLPGGDWITASQCAYVRNPPAAGLGIWITGRRRPVDTPGKRGKAKHDEISPYRMHLRTMLRPSVFTCTANCSYGHPALGRARVPVVRTVAAPRVVIPAPKPEPPHRQTVMDWLLAPRRRCKLGCPCPSRR